MEAEKEIRKRLFQPPEQSFFLFGPRGTGKSTWIRSRYPDAVLIDLLSPDAFRLYSSRPERLSELVYGNPDRRVFVLDEIQKVPALLDVVHHLIEEDRTRVFILTGSSSRKLRRSGVDLLAGRALSLSMHPFMAAELAGDFSLSSALRIGTIPLVLHAPDPTRLLDSYAALYLKEEVQAEGLVRNLSGFARFLEAVSFSHGAILNAAEIARECQVQRKTTEGYLSILEDLLLAWTVPVFTRRAKRILSSHPKLYLFDAGVFRSLRPKGPFDRPEEIDGAALEGLVAQHLRAWISYRGKDNGLSGGRSQAWKSIRLYGEDGLCAIEVKSPAIRRQDLSGCAPSGKIPGGPSAVLHRGTEQTLTDGISACRPNTSPGGSP